MVDHSSDTIANRLGARRFSRRAVLGVGLGATAVVVGNAPAVAQDAAPTPADDVSLLFVQSFATGTLTPKTGQTGGFTLALTGAPAHTLSFSDRPNRLAGTVPTGTFLDVIAGLTADPVNAALAVERDEAGPDGAWEDVLVLELAASTFDETAGLLTYDIRLVDEETVSMRFQAETRGADAIPAAFGRAHLFIDNVPAGSHSGGPGVVCAIIC
jgi:hypothetical protein